MSKDYDLDQIERVHDDAEAVDEVVQVREEHPRYGDLDTLYNKLQTLLGWIDGGLVGGNDLMEAAEAVLRGEEPQG